ncbi:MAG: DUF2804 family protein [Myxococcota bacterium]|nr:DUF2804 family protein [Myxococcota bacterium]
MPRILDRLELAAGRAPETVETVDYLRRRPGPPAIIGSDGRYVPGWFTEFNGALNLDDSAALGIALQRWFHISIDAGDHFIVCNLANLTRAANVALLVAHKPSGAFEHATRTRLYPNVHVQVSDDARCFHDPDTHSFIRVSPDGQRYEISLHVDHLHLQVIARRCLGPDLVQSTRFHRGRGSLQFYGNLEVEHGALTIGDRLFVIPAGSLGTVDRTIGHQRGLQNWNWIACAGSAWDRGRKQRVRFGLQVAKDRPDAVPIVNSQKYAVWLEEGLYKIPSARFDYQVLDPETRRTTPWRIVSDAPGDDWMDLRFHPRFQRREQRQGVLAQGDFNQYYGEVSGRIRVADRSLVLDGVFAVTEDSRLEI